MATTIRRSHGDHGHNRHRWVGSRAAGRVQGSAIPLLHSLPQPPGRRPQLRHIRAFQEDSRLPGSGKGGFFAGDCVFPAVGSDGGCEDSGYGEDRALPPAWAVLPDLVCHPLPWGFLGICPLPSSMIFVLNHRATVTKDQRTSHRRMKMPR